MREMPLTLSGLGIILYSPSAVTHIPEDANYLEEQFWDPADVARHVMACQLTAFCTGTPGRFRLRFLDGARDETAVAVADYRLRLGLQVRDGVICVRDLYDLIRWSAVCPAEQRLPAADGWYRLTVYTSRPPSGILGDNQIIDVHLESTADNPAIRWDGVPSLCE